MRTKEKKVKPKGRPLSSEMMDAREKLLDAAVKLFADCGVAGTTLAQIANKAGVTPAMIHYYFKTRDHLLNAVAEERLLRLVSILWETEDFDWDDPMVLILGTLDRIIDVAINTPWLAELWLKEAVTDFGQLRSRVVTLVPMENIKRFIDAVCRAQASGKISPDINPFLVFNALVGLVLLPLSSGKNYKTDVMPDRKITQENLRKHCRAVVLSGFGPDRDKA